jgi:hypothetical protein
MVAVAGAFDGSNSVQLHSMAMVMDYNGGIGQQQGSGEMQKQQSN